MIKCTTVGVEPSNICYEICVMAKSCGALKVWERKHKNGHIEQTKKEERVMDIEEFNKFMNDLKTLVLEHPIVADWWVEISGRKDIPDVVERKPGEWVSTNEVLYGTPIFKCPVCEKPIFPYCPWCGADMRGQRNE